MNQLSPEVKIKFDEFKNRMQQKRYGDNTVKTYIHQLEIFFGFYTQRKKGQSFATARKTGNHDAGLSQKKTNQRHG